MSENSSVCVCVGGGGGGAPFCRQSDEGLEILSIKLS